MKARTGFARVWPLAAAALLALPPADAAAMEGAGIQWRGLLDVALAEPGRAYELNSTVTGFGMSRFSQASSKRR